MKGLKIWKSFYLFFLLNILFYITKMLYICGRTLTLKTMKWSELRKLAERSGWILLRNGSNHDLYFHPEKDYLIQIGRHKSEEVSKGTYNKLKKQIGF